MACAATAMGAKSREIVAGRTTVRFGGGWRADEHGSGRCVTRRDAARSVIGERAAGPAIRVAAEEVVHPHVDVQR